MVRKTKIIATIGPATLNERIYKKLVAEGIDFVRINTSYGNIKQYDEILRLVEKYSYMRPVKVIFDIKKLDFLAYAKKKNISVIALSFVNNVEQIERVKLMLPHCFLVSKIETQAGVTNFEKILDNSDGIMVARGDLGTAISLEKIPVYQKEFTIKTLNKHKFLIIATEMLLSMANNPIPTRAEVSDVANAIFDKVSAVMLSEETAIGKYPVQAVQFMHKVIKEAEEWISKH